MNMVQAAAPAGAKTEAESPFADFDEFIRLYQQRVYRLVLAQTSEPDLAEELTQECFIRAFQKQKGFRGDCQVFTWLARIAINLVRDHFRNRRFALWRKLIRFDASEPEQSQAEQVPDPASTPEEHLLRRERLERVSQRIQRLTTPQREALLLSAVEGMSIEEISRVTNRRPGTVKSHLHRAMMNLRNWREGEQQ
ncbi:MAG TPA: sigma-70 family RNA polymerase sigma factor [Terriglobales bacterium]|jgi:RNA polymerase sigma-70 factor (ECF subfamily)|nr:sigma-70 family RNA polymerase sigma factor [Terriglobales bacterium]